MRFGLSDEVVTLIVGILRQYSEVEDALIYGSRAMGNFKPDSDIDIALKGPHVNLEILARISNQLDDLLLPVIFDLSVFRTIKNAQLIDHINRVGISLYSIT
jgi:predicted nucleotidyltransferase